MAFYHIYHINRPLITIDGFVDRGRKLNLNLDSSDPGSDERARPTDGAPPDHDDNRDDDDQLHGRQGGGRDESAE